MKKNFPEEIKVVRGERFEEVAGGREWTYPFESELVTLLKKENPFEQEYVYIESGEFYALFTVYKMKLNIFTFGKFQCFLKVKVIGFPCSVSDAGYLTNNEELLFRYVEKMKGAKLILNAPHPGNVKNFAVGETLPTCVFYNRFKSTEEYLDTLRSGYRRRIRQAIAACGEFEVRQSLDRKEVYRLYLNTYQKSDYKLERLEAGFFENVDGEILVFCKENEPRGFVLLKIVDKKLIFMLCGMDYRYETADLYYFMLYTIIEYGIKHQCEVIDLGQTSEETKLKFGAVLEKKYFYAHHSNRLLNGLVNFGKGLLAYKYSFPKYRVFQEGTNEGTTDKTGV